MKIDIDEKEAKVLLAGIRMYYTNLKQCNEDMLEREYRAMVDEKTYQEHHRKNHKDGELGLCCCFGDNNHEKYATLKTNCEQDEQYCADLRDKLKKHQMLFPLEEHETKPGYGIGCLPGSPFCYKDPNLSS